MTELTAEDVAFRAAIRADYRLRRARIWRTDKRNVLTKQGQREAMEFLIGVNSGALAAFGDKDSRTLWAAFMGYMAAIGRADEMLMKEDGQ